MSTTSQARHDTFTTYLLPSLMISATSYPLVRVQSLMQGQLGYSIINRDFKLKGVCGSLNESMNGLFKGVGHHLTYNLMKGSIFYSYAKITGFNIDYKTTGSFLHGFAATIVASAAAYPFELNQNRSAITTQSTTPSHKTFQEVIRTYIAPTNWAGFNLLAARYLLLNLSVYTLHNTSNILLPFLIGAASIPFDVIRRNYLISHWEKEAPYKSVTECAKMLVEKNGYKSLMRGFLTYPELYLIFLYSGYVALGGKNH